MDLTAVCILQNSFPNQFAYSPENPTNRSNITTADDVKQWLGAYSYDDSESIEINIVRALQRGDFPKEQAIPPLQGLIFELGNDSIIFPPNITLINCQVTSGIVMFYHGTCDAIKSEAIVVACGDDAIANATASGAEAYAAAGGAQANANVTGAIAYATAVWAQANAYATGSIAYATAVWAEANAMIQGAVANATIGGAEANAKAPNAIANAKTAGARARAHTSGAIANALAAKAWAYAIWSGAHAHAAHSGSFAIQYKEDTKISSYDGEVIGYKDFRKIRVNWETLENANKSTQEHALAAYTIGIAFCNGKEVSQNDALAIYFLSLAHDLGHLDAAFELGQLYSIKRSYLTQDDKEAIKWYSQVPSGSKYNSIVQNRILELQPESFDWIVNWGNPDLMIT